MIDWNILSPTYLTAEVEWAGTVVTVIAANPNRPTAELERSEQR